MGYIRPGDVIKSIYNGLTVFGVADHIDGSGNWRNAHDGLLVPVDQACWEQITPEVDVFTEMKPERGTMLVVTSNGAEHTILWNGKDWVNTGDGEPIDVTAEWSRWRVVSGAVRRG